MRNILLGILLATIGMSAHASCIDAYSSKAEKVYPSAMEGWDSAPLCAVIFLTAGTAIAPGVGTIAALPVVAACYAYIGHSERLHNVSDLLFSAETTQINADKIYKKLERKVKRRVKHEDSEDLKPLILASLKKLNDQDAFCPINKRGKAKLASLNEMADLVSEDLDQ